MDSEDDEVSTSERMTKGGFLAVTMRWCAAILLPVVSFFFVTLSLSLVAVFVANSSITSPISLRSQCKIVSSSEFFSFSFTSSILVCQINFDSFDFLSDEDVLLNTEFETIRY